MFLGAIIGFILWAIVSLIAVVVVTNDGVQMNWPNIFFSGFVVIGLGASIGYLI